MSTDRKELFKVRFEKHYPRLCSIAYGYVSDRDDSEDIVQETFIHIWDKGKDSLPEQDFIAYLTTAVKNRCITFLRRKKDDTVSIEEGPLKGFFGTVKELNDTAQKAKISTTMFGRNTDVEVEYGQIKRVDAPLPPPSEEEES